MTQRKPAGMSTAAWIEALVQKAKAEGQFDRIEQAPDPLIDLDEPYDEDWWVKQLIRRENLTIMPEMLAVRKAVSDFRSDLASRRDEPAVRVEVVELNRRIEQVNLTNSSPVASDLSPLDVDRVVAVWREMRAAASR